MKLARGAPWRFIGGNAAAAAGACALAAALLGQGLQGAQAGAALLVALVAALAVLWVALLVSFFRDPERAAGGGVVSPADGRVRGADARGAGATLSILLGVLDVHVVRAPIAGRVTALAYKPGGRRLAVSKDSHLNERLVLSIAGEGESCTLTLIAGAFADRILPYVEPGAPVAKGERVGLIKFGSRVDVDFAAARPHALAVGPGSTVIAGQTTILLPAPEAPPP